MTVSNPIKCPRVWQPSPLINGDISLRPVTVADAAFTLALRTDSSKAAHLSATNADLAQQQDWLTRYQQREADETEFYFIIQHRQQPVGTVRLYDFQPLADGRHSFCWGSWIVTDEAPHTTAIQSAMLVYHLGFDRLGFEQAHFDVRQQNHKVVSFHRKMGAVETRQTDLDVFFTLTPDAYRTFVKKFQKYYQIQDC
jgi:RimJ/RimL family protein N-acetyltransferase